MSSFAFLFTLRRRKIKKTDGDENYGRLDTLWCLKLLVFTVIGLGHGNNWVISETIMTDFCNFVKQSY